MSHWQVLVRGWDGEDSWEDDFEVHADTFDAAYVLARVVMRDDARREWDFVSIIQVG